ncbi:MAG: hypothetical protein ACI9K1_002789 [Arcticibacterium sp.]|jgi:hypothetical protein
MPERRALLYEPPPNLKMTCANTKSGSDVKVIKAILAHFYRD